MCFEEGRTEGKRANMGLPDCLVFCVLHLVFQKEPGGVQEGKQMCDAPYFLAIKAIPFFFPVELSKDLG